jgi:hypothetical protein
VIVALEIATSPTFDLRKAIRLAELIISSQAELFDKTVWLPAVLTAPRFTHASAVKTSPTLNRDACGTLT